MQDKGFLKYYLWAGMIFFSAMTYAEPYLPENPGVEYLYQGEMKIGNDIKEVHQTMVVLDAVLDTDSSEKLIPHHIIISTAGVESETVKYYSRKADGIYIVGNSDKPGKKISKFKAPQLILPIPPVASKTWKIDLSEKKKAIDLKYTINKIGGTIKIGDNEYSTIYLTGKGNAKVFMMEIPMIRELWFDTNLGMIKSVTKQTIGKTETVTTLEFVSKKTATQNSTENR